MRAQQNPASPWFTSELPQDDVCCNGSCNENQGRGECPRYASRDDDIPATRTDFYLSAFIVAVIVAFTLAGPMAVDFIAQVLG